MVTAAIAFGRWLVHSALLMPELIDTEQEQSVPRQLDQNQPSTGGLTAESPSGAKRDQSDG